MNEEDIEKYRQVVRMIGKIEKLPNHIRSVKFEVPPHIPMEFRKKKLPSNIFFAPDNITIDEMLEPIKDLKRMIGELIGEPFKSKIDSGE